MPAAVFVSYSHNDRERVVPWVELLQRAGVTVWMDKAGIGGARLWPQEIAEAIQGCQVLLLMLSSSSAASANVVREVNLAMQGDKPILPLLLEPVTIPTALQYPLAGIQQIELFHGECDAQRDPVLSALAGLGVAVPKGPPEVEPSDTSPPESIPTNLPAELTSFIGREQEIAEVKQRLATARLLTLIGAGGTGKTRLALQVAASVLQSYPDGVWLVELAALADPAFVLQEVASVLGVREEPGRPLTATLLDHLRARQLLLVLDNCEHLVSVCATFTQTLLRACPQVRVLATSREALRAAGEIPWRVPSLALPPEPEDLPPAGAGRAQALIQYEAARLFIERAGASRPGFVVTEATAPAIAEICRRLDGIPLAIELAAARVKVLPVEEICRRLDDRFRLLTEGERTALPRQQTLRALIDWSYDLLTEAERALLRRLSVFAGGFSLSAVEAICSGEGVGAEEMLDLLSQLIDKSLVLFQEQEGEGRYWLQETIRQYGAEKLQEAGEVAWVQEGHRRWFLALAEEAEPELRGTAREEWRERLEREHDNIRAALASSVEAGDAESGLRLGGALSYFWYMCGYLAEGRDRLAGLLALPAASLQPSAACEDEAGLSGKLVAGSRQMAVLRAKALNGAGVLARYQGDYQAARQLHEESLTIARELDDKRLIGFSIGNLAVVAGEQGDYGTARMLYEESLAIAQAQGDQRAIAYTLHNLGIIASSQGDYAAARDLYEQSLAIKRELGDRRAVVTSLQGLGVLAWQQGDDEATRAFIEESLEMARAMGDRRLIVFSLNILGLVSRHQGDSAAARALHEESLAIARELDGKESIASSLEGLGNVAQDEGDYVTARALLEQSLALFRDLGRKLGIAQVLEGLARLAVAQQQLPRAARLFGAAHALRRALGAPLASAARAEYERNLVTLREALPGDAFCNAWDAGEAMTPEQAVAEAFTPTADA